jgi:hypothetical protein
MLLQLLLLPGRVGAGVCDPSDDSNNYIIFYFLFFVISVNGLLQTPNLL